MGYYRHEGGGRGGRAGLGFISPTGLSNLEYWTYGDTEVPPVRGWFRQAGRRV